MVLLTMPMLANLKNAKYNRYACVGVDTITLKIAVRDTGLNYYWIIPNKLASIIKASGRDSSWVTIQWPQNTTETQKVMLFAKDTFNICQSTDTLVKYVDFMPLPTPKINTDIKSCEGNESALDVLNIGFKNPIYKWNDSWSNDQPVFTPLQSGNVYLEVTRSYELPNTNLYCKGFDTAYFNILPKPALKLEDYIELCDNQQYEIRPEVDNTKINFFNWRLVYQNNKDTTYTENYVSINKNIKRVYLSITDNNFCSNTDSLFTFCNTVITKSDIPSSGFSPNGDGNNETWELPILNQYPGSTVEVYDRWGNLVFQSSKSGYKPWNGTKDGTELPMDTYYYILNIVDPNNQLNVDGTNYTLPAEMDPSGNGNTTSFSKVGSVVILR